MRNQKQKFINSISFIRLILGFGFIFFLNQSYVSAQSNTDSVNVVQYYLGFPFQEGIYTSFDQYKDNDPLIKADFERRGSHLYVYDDSLKEMVRVVPEKIWGYSQAGNVYISKEGGYWRLINVGALSQFSAIVISTFQTVDSFGFPIEQQSKSMQQLFLDMTSGKVFALSAKQLQPFVEQEPMLSSRFKQLKHKKPRELIMVLKAYNELNPIYFPVYE